MSYRPRALKVSEVKAKLLNPALTSHFYVEIGIPNGPGFAGQMIAMTGEAFNSEKISLACCDAVLPGSSLATGEQNNDYTGVTERHVYRRIYDDRIDLTFYVDAQKYYPIRFFEAWMKYCVAESYNSGPTSPGSQGQNTFYRMRFPNEYKASTLKVHKFERNHESRRKSIQLEYGFVNVFPISIASMPVSYESGSLLKCTVSMNYSRYYLVPSGRDPDPIAQDSPQSPVISDPSNPAYFPTSNNFDLGNNFSDYARTNIWSSITNNSPEGQAGFNNLSFTDNPDINLNYASDFYNGGYTEEGPAELQQLRYSRNLESELRRTGRLRDNGGLDNT